VPVEIAEFKKIILDNYKNSGRVFPWRIHLDPWGILVSEFMLQQTQTARVVPYWERWMAKWPRPEDLAAASLETVLAEWSGLGYNRRAKKLWECAALLVLKYGGHLPETPEELASLPGIGAYSSGAIACFAWNYPALFIETNIRAVMLHFFFQGREGVRDDELFPVLKASLDAENPRVWYWALMDYGAFLRNLEIKANRKSAHYAKQSRFEGSFRQIRGQIVRILAHQGKTDGKKLMEATRGKLQGMEDGDFYRALETLEKEMMVAEEEGQYRISG
jgi:A/G-specific adenine glycosylase